MGGLALTKEASQLGQVAVRGYGPSDMSYAQFPWTSCHRPMVFVVRRALLQRRSGSRRPERQAAQRASEAASLQAGEQRHLSGPLPASAHIGTASRRT